MKRLITVILTMSALMAGVTAYGQASVGAGYSVITDHALNDCKLPGYYIGASYNFTYSGRVGLSAGIYYSRFKGKDLPSFGFDETISGVTEKYLTMPLFFNIGLKFSKDLVLRVFTGPVWSYGLISASGEPQYYDLYGESYGYDKLNMSIGVGAALEVFHMLRFEVGYDNGLKNRSEIEDHMRKTDCVRAGLSFIF